MEVKPIHTYAKPSYPVSGDSSLLRQLPNRWQTNGRLLAALVGVGLLGHIAEAQNKKPPVLMGKMMLPRYINEADACTYAQQEAKKLGVDLAAKAKSIKIQVPDGSKTKSVDYKLDEFSDKKGIGFEFVTPNDVFAVYGKGTAKTPKDLAMVIEAGLKAAKLKEHVKVVDIHPQSAWVAEKARIRKEVGDFLSWLKKQGVI